jgi:hypothetical protein
MLKPPFQLFARPVRAVETMTACLTGTSNLADAFPALAQLLKDFPASASRTKSGAGVQS